MGEINDYLKPYIKVHYIVEDSDTLAEIERKIYCSIMNGNDCRHLIEYLREYIIECVREYVI